VEELKAELKIRRISPKKGAKKGELVRMLGKELACEDILKTVRIISIDIC